MLVWLVCLCMLAGTCTMLVASDAPRSISVQNGTGTRGAVAVSGTYSYRAIVNGSFDGFGYCIPTYNTSDSECTISTNKKSRPILIFSKNYFLWFSGAFNKPTDMLSVVDIICK